jgi:hypothetical protein
MIGALTKHGWVRREDGLHIHADHLGQTIEMVDVTGGWPAWLHRDASDRVIGHSRYRTPLADYLQRLHAQSTRDT